MRVRDWREVVREIVDADVRPDDWRAIAGPRSRGIGEDLYLAHPRRGVYVLKTYPKNPFERRGVGSHVARSIDDEIGQWMPTEAPAKFAVQPAVRDQTDAEARAKRLEETVKTHAEMPSTPDALFEDVMEAIESPAFGPLTYDQSDRPDPLDALSGTFDEAERLLESELDDLLDDDDIGRGFA